MSFTATLRQDTDLWSSFKRHKELQGAAPASPGTPHVSTVTLQHLGPLDRRATARFSSPHLQINSPYRIEKTHLQPFLDHTKHLLLIPTGMEKMEGMLHSLQGRSLIAATDQAARLVKSKSQLVLVVFPVRPDLSYVLQTQIHKVYVDRVELQYQDPRYYPRRQLRFGSPLTFRLIPPPVLAAMEHGELHLTRELGWFTGETPDAKAGYLADLLAEKTSSPTAAMDLILAVPPFSGSIRDISRGGISVSLSKDQPQEEWSQKWVLLHIPLPPLMVDPEGETVTLTLKLLGMIRSVEAKPSSWVLRIQFFESLTAEFDALFEGLERHAVSIQSPA